MEKSISGLLKDFERKLRRDNKKIPDAISRDWEKVLGPRFAAQARIMGIKQNVLTVKVASAPLCQELNNFYKTRLIKGLKETEAGSKIRDIKFTL
ncbi:MAG: DUF721 domain-containing protein [Candidatus Brocadiia bacterium]